MIKRFFVTNRTLTSKCAFQTFINKSCAGLITSGRLVYEDATPPAGPVAPDAGKEITPENLEDTLRDLEGTGKGKLSAKTVTAALKIVKSGTAANKGRLLEATKNFVSGQYDEEDFKARVPEAAATATTETQPAEAKAESGAETAGAAKPGAQEEAAADIGKMRMDTHGDIADIMQQMEGSITQPGTAENKEMHEHFDKGLEKLKKLNDLEKGSDEDTAKKVRAFLDTIVKAGKMSQQQADGIVSHEFESFPPFSATSRQEFDEKTKALNEGQEKLAVEGIRKLKEEQAARTAKINEEARKIGHEFSHALTEAGNAILNKMNQEKTLRNLTISTGIEVREGQQIRYIDKKLGPQVATIKEIQFINPETPLIYVESNVGENGKNTGEKATRGMSPADFTSFVEKLGVTENINSLDELEKSISTKEELEKNLGKKIEKGQKLEFEILGEGDKKEHVEAAILEINKEAGTIELNTPVKIEPHAEPKRTLTYAEFAKWYKHREVMETIETVEGLRDKLRLHNEILNVNHKRNPAHYPPMEVEKDEALKYGDTSGRTYLIKEITDKQIVLDNGEALTFAAFLRWVKKNCVRKTTAETEAAMATEHNEDPAEKAKAEEEIREEFKDRKKKGDEPPAQDNKLPSTDEGAEHSVSYFRKLWSDTRLISPHNMYVWGKTFIDFIKRKMQRREHYAVGSVGERMFGPISEQLSDEFRSLGKTAENEEVELHAKHNRTIGVSEIKEDLHGTTNRERVKAAIIVLCEKGQMRWDDPVFHDIMNKMIKKYGVVYRNGKPVWVTTSNHLESIEAYLDDWFGTDTYRDLRSKNDSTYLSIRQSFKEQAGRLEADPGDTGGLRGALQQLMYRHMRGEYVNPAEYEEYLHYSIEAGKLFFEDKIYFLMMGLGMPGPSAGGYPGQTLLHLDRLGALESEFLNHFPILDYFVDKKFPKVDENGKPIPGKDGKEQISKITSNQFKYWAKIITKGGLENVKKYDDLKFGDGLTELITKKMLWDNNFRTRLDKSSRKADNWDHDDMDMHAPFLSELTIEQIVLRQGNATMNVSTPGLRNALVGFNNMVKVTHEMLSDDLAGGDEALVARDTKGISNMILAFTKLDSVLMNRYKRGGAYSRLSESDYDTKAGADSSREVRYHVRELHDYIARFTREMDKKTNGQYGLADIWATVSKDNMTDEESAKATTEMDGFRRKLQGASSQLSQKELADIMLSIQYGEGASKGNPRVQGILGTKSKTVVTEGEEDGGTSPEGL